MNKTARWASRVGLMVATLLVAEFRNPISAVVLIAMAYLLCVLVQYGQRAGGLYMAERSRKVGA